MKRILLLPTMRQRIGQGTNDLGEFEDRAGPAVREQHRQRVLVSRTDVQKMNIQPVDPGPVLSEPVEHAFASPPIVLFPPIFHQLFQAMELQALGDIRDRLRLRPSGGCQTALQIIDLGLRNMGFESDDARHCGGLACQAD